MHKQNRKINKSLFYFAVISAFSFLIYRILHYGTFLEVNKTIIPQAEALTHWKAFQNTIIQNLKYPLALLLAQITIIVLFARLLGTLFQKIKQPKVIGEMMAGILLGPSFIGMHFPLFFDTLFPSSSLGNLNFLSQIGLLLFMFIVGMELNIQDLKGKARDAVLISHASIIFPFALGVGLAYFIYTSFAPSHVSFTSFALFIGIAMSITAFPVLARIIQEREMQKTKVGTLAITCAAADDVTAWCILAAVIAIVKAGSFLSSLYIIALSALYILFMIKVIRPYLNKIAKRSSSNLFVSKSYIALVFITLICSSLLTEIIGIHALFGAFLAGAIMPSNTVLRNFFINKIEDFAMILLLPLFFVYTGLRTEINLLNDPKLWLITMSIILVAVVGKLIGSTLAARYVGQSWKDSWTLGALMNTRGLMELVVLNIGYDLGVLSPEIFAMMVIMALVTTFMTGPILDLIHRLYSRKPVSNLKL